MKKSCFLRVENLLFLILLFSSCRTEAPTAAAHSGLNRLEELGHPAVRFTVEEDMGHDVWTRVYAGEDTYQWMLKQQKQ